MFSLKDVAAVMEEYPQKVRNWVSSGVIVPAVLGSRSRGDQHQFTAQQLFGLGMAHVMWRWNAYPTDYLTETVEKFSSYTWADVCEFLQIGNTGATRESFVMRHPELRPEARKSSPFTGTVEEAKEILRRVMVIREVVLARLESEKEKSGREAPKKAVAGTK
jgi:hypothetical protein